jgi:hypothetical protein
MTASRIMPCCWLVPRADHCRWGGPGTSCSSCSPVCSHDRGAAVQTGQCGGAPITKGLPSASGSHAAGNVRCTAAPSARAFRRKPLSASTLRTRTPTSSKTGSASASTRAPRWSCWFCAGQVCVTRSGLPHSRMRADTQKAQLPEASCAQRSGQPRIRCNLGLTPYRLPGC